MSKSKLFEKLGQFFMIGFKGKEPSPEFLEFLSEEKIGGVILFEENCASYDVLKENINKIKASYRGMTPLIAVDQEGGRVCRIKGMPAEYHAPSYYASGNMLENFEEDYVHSASSSPISFSFIHSVTPVIVTPKLSICASLADS